MEQLTPQLETASAHLAAPADAPAVTTPTDQRYNANSAKMWKGRIERCKKVRTDLVTAWSENVDYRRGKPFTDETDTDRVNVNLDWSLTKAKGAQLFSQVPQVYLTAKRKEFKSAIAVFAKMLNDTLTEADMGSAVNEAVNDAINASGVGVVLVGYKSTSEQKELPDIDPLTGTPKVVDTTVDEQFYCRRLSPSDLLWSTEFTGSNFDDADWIGHSGTMFWSEAQPTFNLKDEDKEKILGAKGIAQNLRDDSDSSSSVDDPVVEYDELYYWMHRFDSKEKYFKKIGRIVFVQGIDNPVVNEPWAAQVFDEQSRKYAGVCKFPIRILTLTYISDDAIPPSDTAIGRPQVNELIDGRTDEMLQRKRSLPVRWYNPDKVDPLVGENLMRGEYQAFIPIQGGGDRSIGEVARANYPRESEAFDRRAKQDLQEQWQVSSNQVGAFAQGERSAREAGIVQQNFATRIGVERGRVAKLITGISEVMGGFLALYGEITLLGDEDQQRLMTGGWNPKSLAGEYVYYIRPDSTVLLDADQRIERDMKLLNMVGKSGFVNPEPLLEEIIELSGHDPAELMKQPEAPPPDQPNIGYSFKGEDLLNPIAIALLMRAGQAPTPQELQQAIALLQAAMQGGMQPPVDPNAPPGAPPVGGPPGMPPAGPSSPPGAPSGPVPPGVGPVGQAPPADARPNWTPMPRVTKRIDEIGG